jgi:nicotinamide mononucleotide adenylyltransferase
MNSTEQDPLICALHREIEKARSREWDVFYIFVDLHGTVLGSSYDPKDISRNFYDGSISFLQKMTARKDIKLVLWTSSRETDIKKYLHMFDVLKIVFDYVNENPEQKNTSYADFAKKPYLSLILDDKAGFTPDRHWKLLDEAFETIPVLTGLKKRFEVAVTMMRLQSPYGPHSGHMVLISEMFNRADKVLIYIGRDKAFASHKNPLGFDERRELLISEIEAAGFGDRYCSILPFTSRRDNAIWSHELDSDIKAHVKRPDLDASKVGMFHSRDSYAPYYFPHGMFPLVEVKEISGINATALRNSVVSHRSLTPDFITGMVAQQMSQPSVELLVQTRVIVKTTDGNYILVKYVSSDETKYRFVGGYFSPGKDNSFKESAERKLHLKLNISDRESISFIDEVRIDDWRYKEAGTKIACMVYETIVNEPVSHHTVTPGARILETVCVSRDQLSDYLDPEEQVIIGLIK